MRKVSVKRVDFNFFLLHLFFCRWWGVEVELRIVEHEEKRKVTGGGEFVPSERVIYLYEKSLLVYLHEFRHALQYVLKIPVSDLEEDAIEWSEKMLKVISNFFAGF